MYSVFAFGITDPISWTSRVIPELIFTIIKIDDRFRATIILNWVVEIGIDYDAGFMGGEV